MIGEGHVLCSFVKLILGFSNSYEKLEGYKNEQINNVARFSFPYQGCSYWPYLADSCTPIAAVASVLKAESGAFQIPAKYLPNAANHSYRRGHA